MVIWFRGGDDYRSAWPVRRSHGKGGAFDWSHILAVGRVGMASMVDPDCLVHPRCWRSNVRPPSLSGDPCESISTGETAF